MTEPHAPRGPSAFAGPDAPQEADLYRCVHCGLCAQECPTYVVTGLEMESPRGRITLMRALHEGRTGLTDAVVSHLELCLQCRACEAACPSLVPYGRMMEATRAQILRARRGPALRRAVQGLALRHLAAHPGRVRAAAALLRLYQRSGAQRLLRRSGLLRRLPGSLDGLEAALPDLREGAFRPGRTYRPSGPPRGRVALLSGCVMPAVYARTHRATIRALVRNGYQVTVPAAQRCCGALLAHAGDLDAARRLARHNLDVFLAAGVDAVVVNSAGCGAAMKEYGHLLHGDPAYAGKAERFAGLVRDVTEFLADLPGALEGLRPVPVRATYQDSCHLVHAQRVRAAPRRILRAIPGLELAELPHADRCCGSAGIYSLVQPEMSARLLEEKLAEVAATGAAVVATANPGCMIQLEAGLRQRGLPGRVLHVVELLDQAYGGAAPEDVP
ncbi:MAG TPA: heterodisulfide reductase-related iron-sulfur binding cluster [Dehalococcoidia bacterium]